jgi:hypothetical protein
MSFNSDSEISMLTASSTLEPLRFLPAMRDLPLANAYGEAENP